MKDTDFIKWMVGYADGFELESPDTVRYRTHWKSIHNNFEKWDYYPLLIQRAIEGVNRKHTHNDSYPQITIDSTDIEVRYRLTGWNDYMKCLDNFDSIDQAKEQALKYIYEQEQK